MTNTFTTCNPATGAMLEQYAQETETSLTQKITLANQAFQSWRKIAPSERAQILGKLSHALLAEKNSFARLITTEMGKPLAQSITEIEKCAKLCEHYQEHITTYLATEHICLAPHTGQICYEPLGLVLAIMPWNYPFWQVFRAAIPILATGNGFILKHAPNVLGCAAAIQALFAAHIPAHLFQNVILNITDTQQLLKHPLIAAVTLTGSEQAGKFVASTASAHLKKVLLELGGNDPYLILEDAEVETAAQIALRSRLNNSGQVCIAAKRIIAVKPVYEQVKASILNAIKAYTLGDPLLADTAVGPLARRDLYDTVQAQVADSISKGARLLWQSSDVPKNGFYYPITVLENIQSGMAAYHDEIFGPVVTLFLAEDTQHAIEIANDTRFGLGAAVFSQNKVTANFVAQQLQVGICAINTLVSSDPRIPFGGIKNSGFGRELGALGMHEFANIKTLILAK